MIRFGWKRPMNEAQEVLQQVEDVVTSPNARVGIDWFERELRTRLEARTSLRGPAPRKPVSNLVWRHTNETREERVLFAAAVIGYHDVHWPHLSIEVWVSGTLMLSFPAAWLDMTPKKLSHPIHVGGLEELEIRAYSPEDLDYVETAGIEYIDLSWRTMHKPEIL